MRKLTQKEITAKMKEIPGWRRAGKSIERTWEFETFMEAVAFMNRVFALAEDANHHPNLENVWATVKIRYTTHDAGGLTAMDFKMAAKINRVAWVPP